MDLDMVIGWSLVVAALGVLTSFLVFSRRRIDRIARKKLQSARDIIQELHDG